MRFKARDDQAAVNLKKKPEVLTFPEHKEERSGGHRHFTGDEDATTGFWRVKSLQSLVFFFVHTITDWKSGYNFFVSPMVVKCSNFYQFLYNLV